MFLDQLEKIDAPTISNSITFLLLDIKDQVANVLSHSNGPWSSLLLLSVPFGYEALGAKFTSQPAILQAAGDRDRLVILKVESETQLIVGPRPFAHRAGSRLS